MTRSLQWAVALSVAFHGTLLVLARAPAAPSVERTAGTLEVRLASPAPALFSAREAQVAARIPTPTPVHRATPSLPALKPAPAPVAESTGTVAVPGAAQAAAVSAGEERVTPPRFEVAYLNNPPPAYPAMARRMRLEGETRLKVRVSAAGLPVETQLARSSGYEVLDDAAHRAVQSWRFVAARQGAQTVEAWVVVPFKFRLAGEDALP